MRRECMKRKNIFAFVEFIAISYIGMDLVVVIHTIIMLTNQILDSYANNILEVIEPWFHSYVCSTTDSNLWLRTNICGHLEMPIQQ